MEPLSLQAKLVVTAIFLALVAVAVGMATDSAKVRKVSGRIAFAIWLILIGWTLVNIWLQ